jgi:hypothetical protein
MRIVVEEVTEDAVAAEMRRINAMADRVKIDLESMGVDTSIIDAEEVGDAEVTPAPELER